MREKRTGRRYGGLAMEVRTSQIIGIARRELSVLRRVGEYYHIGFGWCARRIEERLGERRRVKRACLDHRICCVKSMKGEKVIAAIRLTFVRRSPVL
jgi:hypothetical protein